MTSLHLAFTTPDLDATAAFYAKLFDVAPDKREVDYVRFTVAEPALVLSLRPGPAGPPPPACRARARKP
jgi:catechol 2,3-dioxygenase-like lactoylglutathione lyase family enzyme